MTQFAATLQATITVLLIVSAVCLTAILLLLLILRGRNNVADRRKRQVTVQYRPIVDALAEGASFDRSLGQLLLAPPQHRPLIGILLMGPLRIAGGDVAERIRRAAVALGLVTGWIRDLDHKAWWVRSEAARALGQLRWVPALDKLVLALDDSHEEVRAAAAEALGMMGQLRAVPPLVERIADESRHQRARLVDAIRSFGTAAIPILIGHAGSKPDDRAPVAQLLGLLHGSEATNDLIEWSTEERANVRAAAFQALGSIGLDDRAFYYAVRALGDPVMEVRAMAARALGRSRRPEAVTYLADRLHDDWSVAATAATALRMLGQPGVAELQCHETAEGTVGLLARGSRWEHQAVLPVSERFITLFAAALPVFGIFIFFYFVTINSLYLISAIVAYGRLSQHRRRWTPRELAAVIRSPATPAISLIVPAFNEEATIVDTVRSLLSLNYPRFEVIVVDDGSTDRTAESIASAFELLPAPAIMQPSLATPATIASYRSITNPDVLMITKPKSGKSDAINVGITAAKYPLIATVDADSLLDEHSLTRAVLPFIEHADTIAVGGIVRVTNGCRIETGRVHTVALPKNPLALFQVVDYLRAFLAARVTHSALNGLLIIPGAFGVFRRDAVLKAGGFRKSAIGEDMELVTRLHRIYREAKVPYRIVFQPDVLCWTAAPETLRALASQRNRWQRGTMQVVSDHRRMILNPRYGAVGLLAMPYHLIFEALGPAIELTGYVVTIVAAFLGLLNWQFAQLIFLTAVVYGTLISIASVVLEEVSYRKYPKTSDLIKLTAYGVLENLGFRQLTTWWRFVGMMDYARGHRGWDVTTRIDPQGA